MIIGDKPVQTMIKMKVEDCIEYSVTEPVRLVFNFREFKVNIYISLLYLSTELCKRRF